MPKQMLFSTNFNNSLNCGCFIKLGVYSSGYAVKDIVPVLLSDKNGKEDVNGKPYTYCGHVHILDAYTFELSQLKDEYGVLNMLCYVATGYAPSQVRDMLERMYKGALEKNPGLLFSFFLCKYQGFPVVNIDQALTDTTFSVKPKPTDLFNAPAA